MIGVVQPWSNMKKFPRVQGSSHESVTSTHIASGRRDKTMHMVKTPLPLFQRFAAGEVITAFVVLIFKMQHGYCENLLTPVSECNIIFEEFRH